MLPEIKPTASPISSTQAEGRVARGPVKFSNPRLVAEFADWPLGGSKRGRCVFRVEQGTGKKGQRISRTTYGKPQYSTYADLCCIVDGDDGRTYLMSYCRATASIHIQSSDFKNAHPMNYVRASDDGTTRFAELGELIFAAQKQATAVAAV